MRRTHVARALVLAISCGTVALTCGCAGNEAGRTPTEQEETTKEAATIPADGTYAIEVDTDSSMFHSDSCTLVVHDGTYTAQLVLPGEGFSKLFYGTAADAANAPDDQVYVFHLNDEGKYCFDIPVPALDEELTIAAFGQRRDTWYDHIIVFHAPTKAAADAA